MNIGLATADGCELFWNQDTAECAPSNDEPTEVATIVDKAPLDSTQETAEQDSAGIEKFYAAVLPDSGYYYVFNGRTKQHTVARSISELTAITNALHESPDIYFATAAYKSPDGRKQVNVDRLNCFWLDIDAGPEKFAKHGNAVYETQAAALRATIEFCKAIGLPPSIIVSSGAGLHIYFCLDEAIAPDQWKPVARRLHELCVEHGYKADPSVTTDTARVLRPPGSLHKSGVRVKVLRDTGKRYTFQELTSRIGAGPPRKWDTSINQEVLGSAVQGPPRSIAKIVQHCAAIQHTAENQASVSEPLWRGMIGIAKHTVEGDEAAHKFSQDHPSYSEDETQRKFDAWNAGPTTCTEFSKHFSGCRECPHFGKIKSPIVLGDLTPAQVQELPPEQQPVAAPVEPKNARRGVWSEAEALAEINRAYFVAPDGSGKTAIHKEGVNPETGLSRLVILSRSEFLLDLENKLVRASASEGTEKLLPAGPWWLKHPSRRAYPAGVVLQPEGEAPEGAFNTYRGLAVAPAAGDVQPMIDHVSMLCGGDAELIIYVTFWMAFCVQRPGSRPEVAVVFRGPQGSGKGTLVRLMLRYFGIHGLHITQQSHLVGNFNAHLRYALFLFVDEGYWAGDPRALGPLRGLVTEPTTAIEMKGHDVFSAPNRLKMMMASNNAWVIPADADERRYCVVDVPSARVGDHAYFDELNRWIESGGAEAWLEHLLRADLSGFNPRAVPSTAALDAQKVENLPPMDRWILEALDQGSMLGGGADWLDGGANVACSSAVDGLSDYCKRAGGRFARADVRVIGSRLDQIFRCGAAKVAQFAGRRGRAWQLPGLAQARQMAAAAFGLRHYVWSQP